MSASSTAAAWQLPRRQNGGKEPAWHRRQRRKRSEDRVVARITAATFRLATHHGSDVPRLLKDIRPDLVNELKAKIAQQSAEISNLQDTINEFIKVQCKTYISVGTCTDRQDLDHDYDLDMTTAIVEVNAEQWVSNDDDSNFPVVTIPTEIIQVKRSKKMRKDIVGNSVDSVDASFDADRHPAATPSSEPVEVPLSKPKKKQKRKAGQQTSLDDENALILAMNESQVETRRFMAQFVEDRKQCPHMHQFLPPRLGRSGEVCFHCCKEVHGRLILSCAGSNCGFTVCPECAYTSSLKIVAGGQ